MHVEKFPAHTFKRKFQNKCSYSKLLYKRTNLFWLKKINFDETFQLTANNTVFLLLFHYLPLNWEL